jgi:hypothetical protein
VLLAFGVPKARVRPRLGAIDIGELDGHPLGGLL